MTEATKLVRIWPEVHAIYKDIADRYGFYLSNLLSAILLEAGANTSVVFHSLVKHFDVSLEEAEDIATELHNAVVRFYNLLFQQKAGKDAGEVEVSAKEA